MRRPPAWRLWRACRGRRRGGREFTGRDGGLSARGGRRGRELLSALSAQQGGSQGLHLISANPWHLVGLRLGC